MFRCPTCNTKGKLDEVLNHVCRGKYIQYAQGDLIQESPDEEDIVADNRPRVSRRSSRENVAWAAPLYTIAAQPVYNVASTTTTDTVSSEPLPYYTFNLS